MKVLPTRRTQTKGEKGVAGLANEMGHFWRNTDGDSYGIDGYIELVQDGHLTGQLIAVQIKSGRSYLANARKARDKSPRMPMSCRRIKLKHDHLNYFKMWSRPVIVVWFDPISENAFWGQVSKESASPFPVPHVFDRFTGRAVARVVRHWNESYPEFSDPRQPHTSIKDVKRKARQFYAELRKSGCESPAFGYVQFTLRGWRHITRQNGERAKVLRSLELLGAAKEIISRQTHFRLCRVTAKGHLLYKQTARVTHPKRADAIVSVITERIGDGSHQFLSVYEHGTRARRSKNNQASSVAAAPRELW